jgi:hypothetical protein
MPPVATTIGMGMEEVWQEAGVKAGHVGSTGLP